MENFDIKRCTCGKFPMWSKVRGIKKYIVACADPHCKLYLSVCAPSLKGAIETWNEEVAKHEKC